MPRRNDSPACALRQEGSIRCSHRWPGGAPSAVEWDERRSRVLEPSKHYPEFPDADAVVEPTRPSWGERKEQALALGVHPNHVSTVLMREAMSGRGIAGRGATLETSKPSHRPKRLARGAAPGSPRSYVSFADGLAILQAELGPLEAAS